MKQKRNEIIVLITFIIISNITIIFNIPIFRQLFGYIFLTILPGMLLLPLFNLNNMKTTKKIIILIGLSLFFIMSYGLLFDLLSFNLGLHRPLSSFPLLISFNVAYAVLLTINYYFVKQPIGFLSINVGMSINEKKYLIVPLVLPTLSILGIYMMKYYSSNTILISFLLLILVYVILISIKNNKVPDKVYVPILFLISISLMLSYALLSNHIYGSDSHQEYYFFQLISSQGHWDVYKNLTLDSCLCISILPTIYQVFLNTTPECLFKLIYLLPISLIPIITFLISKKYISCFYSFLAAMFVISQSSFLFYVEAYRTYLAIFFFSIILMLLFDSDISTINKRVLYFIFIFSGVVSHYSTTYIFLFILVAYFLLEKLYLFLYGTYSLANKNNQDKNGQKNKLITFNSLIFFLLIVFIWYSQVTGAAFTDGIIFVSKTLMNLFATELRDPTLSAAFGSTLKGSAFLTYYNFIISWISVLFTIIGLVVSLFNLIKTNEKHQIYIAQAQYILFAFVCFALLVIGIVTPYIFISYSLPRTQYQLMVVLSTFFVIGGLYLDEIFKSKQAHILILIVVISFYANSTGLLPQAFGRTTSPILNSPKQVENSKYIFDSESDSAKWLKNNMQVNSTVYSDFPGYFRLMSSGLIDFKYIDRCQFTDISKNINRGYIYLRYDNIIRKTVHSYSPRDLKFSSYDIDSLNFKFNGRKVIYTNGYSTIWN